MITSLSDVLELQCHGDSTQPITTDAVGTTEPVFSMNEIPRA